MGSSGGYATKPFCAYYYHKFSRPAASLRVRGIQKSLELAIKPEKAKNLDPAGFAAGRQNLWLIARVLCSQTKSFLSLLVSTKPKTTPNTSERSQYKVDRVTTNIITNIPVLWSEWGGISDGIVRIRGLDGMTCIRGWDGVVHIGGTVQR